MSEYIISTPYEPLIKQTHGQNIRNQSIITIAIVALIAVGFAQIFGKSDNQDFLGAKNQISLAGVPHQITIAREYPDQNFIDKFANKDLTLIGKMDAILTNSKVNAEGKRLVFSDDEVCNVHSTLGDYYSISGVQDAALDSNGIIYAIATQDLGNDQYKRFGSLAKFYSNKLYRNVEVYQEKPVLNNGGGLFALSCGQHNDSLYQVMRWNKGLDSWEKIDNMLAEKIATYSNEVVYIYRQSSIFELIIKK
ncbi:UNKNOWN [Stylonychia lemnae]|uniref:Uncharacterized protein n=1 Tax=Stylonychia lemnae TaxID=5949 RepID=A0A078B374_STYLE|nr:UNKNOWN [Stylonychia lemnae]|eukprot:CDW88721.1 UNKNOWN [Stylonychia lemnae]